MKKSLLEFYALAICFVTVVCLVIALGIATYGVVGMANPEFTLSTWVYPNIKRMMDSGVQSERYSSPKQCSVPSERASRRSRVNETTTGLVRGGAFKLATRKCSIRREVSHRHTHRSDRVLLALADCPACAAKHSVTLPCPKHRDLFLHLSTWCPVTHGLQRFASTELRCKDRL